jgi:hypothetical protein
MAVSTLDPAHTQASITLSGGNLIGTSNGGGPSQQSGLATTILTPNTGTGKWFWDGQLGGSNAAVLLGFGNASADLTTYCGFDTNSVGVIQTGYAYYNNSNFAGPAQSWGLPGPSHIAFALDLVNKKFWTRVDAGSWNNDGSADPTTNVGGYDISSLVAVNSSIRPMYTLSASGSNYTINLGGTTFAYPIPTGYQAANTWAGVPAYGQMLLCNI